MRSSRPLTIAFAVVVTVSLSASPQQQQPPSAPGAKPAAAPSNPKLDQYTFKGESAHAAGAPWRGRSALDAVELMDVGWNFRREHLRLQQRSHYVRR